MVENIKFNELKLNNENGVNKAKAPSIEFKNEKEKENTSKDMLESKQNEEQKTTKHVIIYLGSGEYIDANGNKWHKNDEKTFSDDEYRKRTDLEFMVKYGEMKHTAVTM